MVLDLLTPINAPCEELSSARGDPASSAHPPDSPFLRAVVSRGAMSGERSQQRWVKMDG